MSGYAARTNASITRPTPSVELSARLGVAVARLAGAADEHEHLLRRRVVLVHRLPREPARPHGQQHGDQRHRHRADARRRVGRHRRPPAVVALVALEVEAAPERGGRRRHIGRLVELHARHLARQVEAQLVRLLVLAEALEQLRRSARRARLVHRQHDRLARRAELVEHRPRQVRPLLAVAQRHDEVAVRDVVHRLVRRGSSVAFTECRRHRGPRLRPAYAYA